MRRTVLLFFFFLSPDFSTHSQDLFWEALPSVPLYPSCMAVSQSGDLFLGNHQGIWKSTDNGDKWSQAWEYDGYATTVVEVVVDSSGTVLASFIEYSPEPGDYPGMVRSVDKGLSWTRVPIDDRLHDFGVRYDGTLFAGSYNRLVFRSVDSGGSWEAVSEPITGQHVSAIGFDNDGVVYVGTRFDSEVGEMYYSSNNGDSWLPWPSPGRPVTCLSFDDNDTVFAGVSDADFLVTGGVFRSIDGGVHWDRVMTVNASVSSLVSVAATRYVGTFGQGVFRSGDGGDSWGPVNTGLTYYDVYQMLLHPGGHLFALTVNGGTVFRSTNTVTDIVAPVGGKPELYLLSQNYPNPFNPSTTISFSIPQSSFITLTVFDLLGREVATIVNEKLGTGRYERSWDAGGMPSGVYFYRLHGANFIDTKKFILLR